jgi:hypothetical protein
MPPPLLVHLQVVWLSWMNGADYQLFWLRPSLTAISLSRPDRPIAVVACGTKKGAHRSVTSLEAQRRACGDSNVQWLPLRGAMSEAGLQWEMSLVSRDDGELG